MNSYELRLAERVAKVLGIAEEKVIQKSLNSIITDLLEVIEHAPSHKERD